MCYRNKSEDKGGIQSRLFISYGRMTIAGIESNGKTSSISTTVKFRLGIVWIKSTNPLGLHGWRCNHTRHTEADGATQLQRGKGACDGDRMQPMDETLARTTEMINHHTVSGQMRHSFVRIGSNIYIHFEVAHLT